MPTETPPANPSGSPSPESPKSEPGAASPPAGTPGTPNLTSEQQKAISNAKGSIAKRTLWWVFGIVGVILAIVIGVLLLIVRKGPAATVAAVVEKTRQELDKAEVEAKVEAAKATGVHETEVKRIEEVAKIEDETERRNRLAELAMAPSTDVVE